MSRTIEEREDIILNDQLDNIQAVPLAVLNPDLDPSLMIDGVFQNSSDGVDGLTFDCMNCQYRNVSALLTHPLYDGKVLFKQDDQHIVWPLLLTNETTQSVDDDDVAPMIEEVNW